VPAGSHSYIRPGFLLRSVVNPIVGGLGLAPALIVRGRLSGRSITVPMGRPLELAGQRYLVSGRGETHWVRNLRAAGRAEFRMHGRREVFRPVELQGPEQAHIVAAYRDKLGGSLDAYFRTIPSPSEHPVFRMDALADNAQPR
jgi:hypothetical protein